MRTRLSGIALAGLLATMGVAACGGDDGEKSSPTSKDDKDKDKDSTAGQVACGSEICKPPSKNFMGQLCCKSAFDGKCGQMVAGTCTDLPPASHPKCDPTSFAVMGNMVDVPSCCTTNDECGLVFNAGFGAPMCTSLTQASMLGTRFGGGMMMFNFTGSLPKPKKCSTGEPIEVAGSGAAGSGS